ncbi:MAG: FKBP-type peptidyl-prolyl cis-trans isomerase [Thermoplasmatota archaeon]
MRRELRAAAVLGLAAALLLDAGCITGPAPEEPAVQISPIESSLLASAGDNVTFIVLLKNNRNNQEVLSVTLESVPGGWSASLSNQTFELGPRARKPAFVLVSVPKTAEPGSYKIVLRASATLGKGAESRALTVRVAEPQEAVVGQGSTLKVDYTGYLASFEVFDTSVRDVGSDIYIPKSSTFSPPALNKYEPLSFRVGDGDVVPGFERGVIGMGLKHTRTIAVEPRDGYGKFERVTIPLSESFPMVRQLTVLNFTATYGEEPSPNKVVLEPYWGWRVQVVNVTQGLVTLLSLPEPNQTSNPYGWESRVVDVNGSADGGLGRIDVRHYPAAGTNVTYKGIRAELVELTATHAELEYNVNASNPLATQTLYFIVKVVSMH